MSLATICTRHVITVDAAASLAEAARRLREHHVGALVVTRAGAEGVAVAGVVTDRDLAVEVLARGLDAAALAVGTLVQGEPVAVPESAGVDEALAQMRAHGVRRLPVAGAQGQLVGIVTLDDSARRVCRAARRAGPGGGQRHRARDAAARRAGATADPAGAHPGHRHRRLDAADPAVTPRRRRPAPA